MVKPSGGAQPVQITSADKKAPVDTINNLITNAQREGYDKLEIPAVDIHALMTGVSSITGAGWIRVNCSDTRLSSALLVRLVQGQRLDDLEIRLPDYVTVDSDINYMDPAQMLFELILEGQTNTAVADYIRTTRDDFVAKARKTASAFKKRVGNISFTERTWQQHLTSIKDDSRAIVLLAIPDIREMNWKITSQFASRMSGLRHEMMDDYEEAVDWLLEWSAEAKPLVITRVENAQLKVIGPGQVFYLGAKGEGYLSNRRGEAIKYVQGITAKPKNSTSGVSKKRILSRIPVFRAADSPQLKMHISTHKISKVMAAYYANAWGNAAPISISGSRSSCYAAILLDNRLAAIIGYTTDSEELEGDPQSVRSTVRLTPPREGDALQKLALALTVNTAVIQTALDDKPLQQLERILIDVHSATPDSETMRGILMHARVKIKQKYRLTYTMTPLNNTIESQYNQWIKCQ